MEAQVFECRRENWTHAQGSLSFSCECEMVVGNSLASDAQAALVACVEL